MTQSNEGNGFAAAFEAEATKLVTAFFEARDYGTDAARREDIAFTLRTLGIPAVEPMIPVVAPEPVVGEGDE